ncbi:MAG: hypothetical protein JOZ87_06955 [Chloroflexi bacterium]|nr:hypothetical protein [Chloroflexota bacterium]
MHASLGRYERCGASQAELVQVGRQLARLVSQAPGFISYALLEARDGMLATVSVFETEAQLEEADRLLADWLAAHATPLARPLATLRGEILVQKGM